jgi:hypothetical protein
MTEFDEDFEDDNDDESVTQKPALDKNIRAQLRKADKDREELAAVREELAAAKRNANYDKAGIPEDGLGSMFRKGYVGDDDVESIRKSAVDMGLINAVTSKDDLNDSELDALRRTQGATTGSDGNSPDASQLYLTQLAESKSVEDVMAAVNGDSGKKIGVFSNRGAL